MANKIVTTINQNRAVATTINPKAILPNVNIAVAGQINLRSRPSVIKSQSFGNGFFLDISVLDGPAIIGSDIAFILGSETNGVLGISDPQPILGDEALGEIDTLRVVNANNLFIETWDFSDFINSSLTTATVDTINRQVTFTAGEVLTTKSIYADADATTNVQSVRPFVRITNGSVLIETSADGGTTWQTTSNNSTTSLTVQGKDLRLRVTENNSSTATIGLTSVSYNLG